MSKKQEDPPPIDYTARDAVAAGLAAINAMPLHKQHAFLGLFAGAITRWNINPKSGAIFAGKAECEITEWREFFGTELVELGLVTFTEGATPHFEGNGETKWVEVRWTELGYSVREEWWAS